MTVILNPYSELLQSKIITTDEQWSTLCNWLTERANSNGKMKLLYRFNKGDISSFHKKCENVDSTLVIIQTDSNFIIGGYTKQTWDGSGYKEDPYAFIFSITNKVLYPIRKTNKAIYSSQFFGPVFGEGDLFCAGDFCFVTISSMCYGDGRENVGLVRGNDRNSIKEMEVYKVYHH